MKDIANAISKINNYLRMPIREVCLVAFNRAKDLEHILRETSGCKKIHLSRYCPEADSTPNLDMFLEDIRHSAENLLVLGVGEYIGLTGSKRPLEQLRGLKPDSGKIIVLVWNGYELVRHYQKNSQYSPFADRYIFLPQGHRYWRFKNFALPHEVEYSGFRAILEKLENGCEKEITVRTGVSLCHDFGITINSSYQLYRECNPASQIPQNLFTEEQWNRLALTDIARGSYFFGEANFLRLKENGSDNKYLAHVLANTDSFADFKKNFIALFLELDPHDPDFKTLSADRRIFLRFLDGGDMDNFITQLQRHDGIKKLPWLGTDTLQERFEIIKIASGQTPDNLDSIYKDLALYLDNYIFPETGLAAYDGMLSQYFNEYKYAKLRNSVPANFSENDLQNSAKPSIFNLPTRWAILEKLNDGKNMLFWLDSLGCEYLAFIQSVASEHNLAMKIQVARAELPSITSINSNFYNVWQGPKEAKITELDDIKHGKNNKLPAGGLRDFPLHLALELDVIRTVMERIAKKLASREIPRIVLTSDHGATRLAVISGCEDIWEMPEPGRHGGRCCKASDAGEYKPACAILENGWYCLLNYSRFKGSHSSSVEVHGGATLEEAVVPVIVFSLRDSMPVIVQKEPREFKIKYKDKNITIGIHSNMPLDSPLVHFAGNIYPMYLKSKQLDYYADIPVSVVDTENEALVFNNGEMLTPALRFTVIKGMKTRSFDGF